MGLPRHRIADGTGLQQAELTNAGFIGTHLVWQYDDLSTAAYVDGSNILSIDGRTLAELDLAENEYVYGLSYSQDGTVLTATIVSSEETERIVRLTLP